MLQYTDSSCPLVINRLSIQSHNVQTNAELAGRVAGCQLLDLQISIVATTRLYYAIYLYTSAVFILFARLSVLFTYFNFIFPCATTKRKENGRVDGRTDGRTNQQHLMRKIHIN